LKRLFSCCGALKDVQLKKNPGSEEKQAASLVIAADHEKVKVR